MATRLPFTERIGPGLIAAGIAAWVCWEGGSVCVLLFAVAGAFQVIRLALRRRRERLESAARAYSLTQPGPHLRDLSMASHAPAMPIAQAGLRPPATTWAGAFLVLAALAGFAGIRHWIATRTIVAVDRPVSLGLGHVRTGPFRINLSEYYRIDVDTDCTPPYLGSCAEYPMLETRWILRRGGRVAGAGQWGPSTFESQPGVYDLDVEILRDASLLNAVHPRLRVSAYTDNYTVLTVPLLWLCVIGMGTGAGMLLMAGARWLRRAPPPVACVAPGVLPGMVSGSIRWKRRPSNLRLISGLSPWALIATITYILIWIVVEVACFGHPIVPKGLLIHLLRPGAPAQSSPGTPGIQPLYVRLECGGHRGRPSLYVDWRPMPWQEFDALLQKELVRRPPNWPVYLEGDPDMDWQYAADAIDRIRGLHAEVVLLTSRPPSSWTPPGSRTTAKPARPLSADRR
jgi:hypothetical protein